MTRSIVYSGSAFHGNVLNSNRPISNIQKRDRTNYVSLSRWCKENYISKRIGRELIKKKLLIAQKLLGQWWVCANLDCYQELLDYLGLDELFFDADNQSTQ